MKKVIVLLAVLSMTASAQQWNTVGASVSEVVYVLKGWSPWTADSSVTKYTPSFDVSEFDSIDCFVFCTSSDGKPNFAGQLEVSPTGYGSGASGSVISSANSYLSVSSTALDTTSVKTEVMTRTGRFSVQNCPLARFKLTPNTAQGQPTIGNRKDAIVGIAVTGVRRAYRNPR